MPGPSNNRRRRKATSKTRKNNTKKSCKSKTEFDEKAAERLHELSQQLDESSPPSSTRSPSQLLTPSPVPYQRTYEQQKDWENLYAFEEDQFLPPTPYIHDPGNGPRVRDTRAFLSSSFFAQKPALDIPLCAEFAQPEILEMLRTVLPEETALILWYNKSRATSRICPACQRLYRLGDNLPGHVTDIPTSPKQRMSPYLRREQEISGLCSPVCFILASFNYPSTIKQAWGRMADEIDDQAWEIMNGVGEGNATGEVGIALGLLVKMTRLHDLGLDQLCLDLDLVEDLTYQVPSDLPVDFKERLGLVAS
ncbi:hypothetical protein AX17_003068 [Amanita inopinata Kibby_2008]|nr:hypothetical protein AX17_003068 [Amanita inopinata Kibby_2008]